MLIIFLLAICAGLPTALIMFAPSPRAPQAAAMFDAEDWRQMREHLPPDVYAWVRERAE
jgi:hypothetical protein